MKLEGDFSFIHDWMVQSNIYQIVLNKNNLNSQYTLSNHTLIIVYELIIVHIISIGHVTLAATTKTIILVPYLLNTITATHLKIVHP